MIQILPHVIAMVLIAIVAFIAGRYSQATKNLLASLISLEEDTKRTRELAEKQNARTEAAQKEHEEIERVMQANVQDLTVVTTEDILQKVDEYRARNDALEKRLEAMRGPKT